MTDLRQSLNYSKYMQSIGWQVEKIPQFVYIRKLALLGSIIKIQRPQWPIDFRRIDQTAKRHKALLVKLELPQQWNNETMEQLEAAGFQSDRSPLLPPKTIWLDLTKTEEELLKGMKKDARSSLRKAEKQDIKILRYEDIKEFHQDFRKYGRGYIPKIRELNSLIKAFKKDSLLIVSKYFNTLKYESKKKKEILAGALFLISGKTAYYFYAFTSPAGRKNFSQYALVWQAIKELKKRRIKTLDLEGIYDPRFKFTRKWQGFSHFKKSFGGREVTFFGSLTKYYHPIFKILHFLNFW